MDGRVTHEEGNDSRDLVIVGSGAASFAAAIEACRAGARVAMVEKDETLGGTSIVCGGGCWMVGTPLQESLGIKDDPDQAFEDWVKSGQGAADEPWARFYIEHTLHDLYFWAEGLGVKWVDMKVQQGNRVHRWHRAKNNGLGLMTALMDEARARGLKEIYTSTRVTEILIEEGKVCGVRAIQAPGGKPVDIRAKTTLMATGGFCSNLDMIFELRPDLKGNKIMEGSGRGADGSGHGPLQRVGAYMTHLDYLWFYVYATPDYRDPRGRRGLVFRWTPGYIWVNQQGRRFHNETRSGAAAATPVFMAQNPRHAWAVMDTPMTAIMEVADPYYRDGDKIRRERVQELLDNSPYIRKADSLQDLARGMEVDVPTFMETVKRYNSFFEKGLDRDPDFGKPLKDSKTFDTPPYYAVQLFPLSRKNLGGVKTDLKCRVMNKHFELIPGLYAAGEVAGMAGGHINGRLALEGTMLGPAIISGRVAGAWAAAEAGHGRGFIGRPNRP
ncbi:MAG: FAD-dependent oxidoreductase [Pseudomonadota bacterium]